jgi:hypothetical protein
VLFSYIEDENLVVSKTQQVTEWKIFTVLALKFTIVGLAKGGNPAIIDYTATNSF